MFVDERTTISIAQTAENIPIDPIDRPYNINIEENRSSLKDGVYIRLHTKMRCQLRVFWFVPTQNFYSEMDSIDFRLSLVENRFLKDNCAYQEIFNFDSSGEYVQHIQFSDAENYLTQNNRLRQKYPLVIVVHRYIDDDDRHEFYQLPIQLAVLHVKSSVSNDPPTKFIMKISKLANGQTLVLQDIFTPGGSTSEDSCSICLTERANHVLLPCKHACICDNCFSAVDKCPICQKLVLSYFKI